MVETITGVTEKRAIKGFRPYLALSIAGTAGVGADCFSDVRAELRIVDGSKGRDEKVIPDVKLKVLAEHAAKANGQYFVKRDKSGFEVLIDLTAFGGIDLNAQKYIELNLYGLYASATYVVRGIESDEFAGYYYRWSKMNINAGNGNQTMRYDNAGSEVLVLPLANLVEVNFIHKKGGTKRWNVSDLKNAMRATNPIVRYDELGAVVCGFDELYVGDIDECQTYEITTNGQQYEFYTVDTKAE